MYLNEKKIRLKFAYCGSTLIIYSAHNPSNCESSSYVRYYLFVSRV